MRSRRDISSGRVRVKMYYIRPTFTDEVLHFFRTLYSLYWCKSSMEFEGSCVLLVMDVIEAYKPLYSEKTLGEVTKAIEAARQKQCKIIFTRWVRSRTDSDMDEIDKKGHWSFFVPVEGTGFIIEPGKSDIIVDVRHTSAFVNSSLCEHVNPDDTLVLTGGWGESCIINTVRDATDRNMKTAVIKNACAGHTGLFQYAMFVLHSVYTTVYSTVMA